MGLTRRILPSHFNAFNNAAFGNTPVSGMGSGMQKTLAPLSDPNSIVVDRAAWAGDSLRGISGIHVKDNSDFGYGMGALAGIGMEALGLKSSHKALGFSAQAHRPSPPILGL